MIIKNLLHIQNLRLILWRKYLHWYKIAPNMYKKRGSHGLVLNVKKLLFLHNLRCCGYLLESSRLVEAILIDSHNIWFYGELTVITQNIFY